MFQEEYGIPIGHRYGPSEVGLAYCCRTGHGFHFYPTYGQVDYFPRAGRLSEQRGGVVQPGSSGSSSICPWKRLEFEYVPRHPAQPERQAEAPLDNSQAADSGLVADQPQGADHSHGQDA
jgi:hypothetical protein